MLTFRVVSGTLTCASSQGSLTVFPEGAAKTPKGEGQHVLLAEPQGDAEVGIISWPGEYDYGGITVRGIGQGDPGKVTQVSYVVTTEELRCGFLASPLRAWEEHEIELLGDLDVLVVPADDAKLAQHLVEEVDPPVVIPVRGKDDKAYQEVLRACGAKDVEAISEVKLKKSGLPADSRVVYVLASE